MNGIARIWRGTTRPENADLFQTYLMETVFPDFEQGLTGYRGAQLLKRTVDDAIEFTTIMWFDSLDSYGQPTTPRQRQKELAFLISLGVGGWLVANALGVYWLGS